MRVSIIGTGYVGLVSGVCLAEKGHSVVCIDIDKEKIEKINNCIPPIFENGLEELLGKNIKNKHLVATTDLKRAVLESDISIIAVGTPFDGKNIDLTFIKKASEQIGATLKEKQSYHTVVVKSTVIPGTTDEVIVPALEKHSKKKAGIDFGVGMNPEFLREGCAIKDFMNPDRIIIGGIDEETMKNILQLYENFDDVDMILTNNKTAEMIKYASNSLLATFISFSNEIANICALTKEVDVKDVMAGVHLDKRLNTIMPGGERVNPAFLSYLEAGCGFGGSCFPKDIKALVSYAESKGQKPALLKSVIEINKKQPKKLIDILDDHFESFENLNVAVLGLAFKANTDDMRESPALLVIESLIQKGVNVRAYDPIAMEEAKKILGTTNIKYTKTLDESLDCVDVVILITHWDEFDDLHISLNKLEKQPLIIDGRRKLNKKHYKKYKGVGLNYGK
ncbi:MAG: UDP-glucose/GDP-mannose dehydrogenase family protein [Candidatus Aenigmarchaeota archaeon]|nr:UDP-glucose/GDP-mannose dehydrogenase family protein [Candidatus Aenigmarchaeota archaeon]